MISHARHLHDQIVEAQKPRKDDQARTANRSVPPGGSRAPSIDWQHVRGLAERTNGPRGPGPELVITSAACDDIPLDEMPELEEVVRQS